MKARILIVDDHEVVRRGARAILQKAQPEWDICGEASTGREAIRAVATYEPDIVILDVSMPDMTGIEATPVIAKVAPNCRILLFTMHESEALLTEAQQLGAQGYVQKSQAGRDLVVAVDRLIAGGTFFGSPDNSSAGAPQKKNGDKSSGISSRISLGDVGRSIHGIAPIRRGVEISIGNFGKLREDLAGSSLIVLIFGDCIPLLLKYLRAIQSGCTVARVYAQASKMGNLTSYWGDLSCAHFDYSSPMIMRS